MVSLTLLGLFSIVAVVLIIYLPVITKSPRFRERDTINNTTYIRDYIMQEKRKKSDGTTWWQSVPWQKKLTIEKPPVECMDVGKSGRLYCEGYKLGDGEYAFIRDGGLSPSDIRAAKKLLQDARDKITTIKAKLDENPGDQKLQNQYNQALHDVQKIKERPEITVLEKFQPFSTTERQVILAQYAKAEKQRQRNWKHNMPNMVALGSLAIIVISLFVFWGDLAQPALNSHNLALEVQRQNTQILQALPQYQQCMAQEPTAIRNDGISSPESAPPRPDDS